MTAMGVIGNNAGSAGAPMSLGSEENLQINATQRVALMQKLANSRASAKESQCIVLTNMVGPNEVDDDLQNEVKEECDQFGAVEKVCFSASFPVVAVLLVLC